MTRLDIGVLAVQGDVAENVIATKQAMTELGIEGTVHIVKTPLQMANVDGLIIPGGESTTIGQLSLVNNSLKQMKEKIESGMPVLGICAGMVMLSKTAKDRVVGKTDQPLLDILNVTLERNSFGRQRESFETDISLTALDIPKFRAVFIRSPSISEAGSGVDVLAKLNEKIVAVKEGNIIATSFHPELSDDNSLHKYFVRMVAQAKNQE